MSSVRVFDQTNTTWLGDVSIADEVDGFTWGPLTGATAPTQLNQINECRVTVPANHPLRADLTFGNVLRFYKQPGQALDAAFNACFVEVIGEVEVDSKNELTVELAGRTLESVLDRMLVRGWVTDPSHEPQADARAYNHAAPAFDTSTMTGTLHEMSRATSTPQRPLAWPDPYTAAVWTQAEAASHPVGPVHLVRDFLIDTEDPLQIVFFYSGDDEAVVWCDGVRLAGQEPVHPSDVWHHTWKVAVLLEPGLHRFALDGYNYAATGPGALWASAWRTNGTLLGDPIFILGTNEANPFIGDWKVTAYPSAEPGFTGGKILRTMIEDPQGDGCAPTLALDFDDVEDSNGDPWPIISGYRPLLDQSVWTATTRLREAHLDMRMKPGDGLTLQAFDKTTGVGSASGETIAAGPGGKLQWLKRTTRGLL